MVSIYRGHACLYRKVGGIDNNFVELLYEFSRVAEYYIYVRIYMSETNIWKLLFKNNTIYNYIIIHETKLLGIYLTKMLQNFHEVFQ